MLSFCVVQLTTDDYKPKKVIETLKEYQRTANISPGFVQAMCHLGMNSKKK